MTLPAHASGLRMPSLRTALLLPAILIPLFPLTLSAQEEIDSDVIVMDAFVAAAEADVYDVLPKRESTSVFGTSRSLEETPRSVTLIESAMTDLYGIRTVNDFVSVTAGSFTGNYFGVPGALDVRGERADNFFRGMRRIENRGNFPTPIASTDYVEIIKGPAPPVYGGGKVGGILNFIPKTAKSKTAKFIDTPVGIATVTVGNYGKMSGSLEYGTPFEIGGMRSGAYVFVQAEDSDHYYTGIYNKSTLLQVALDTELSESVLLEYGFMAQWSDLNQSLGWNRVTQDLIDSEGALYLGGQAALKLDTDGNGILTPAEVSPYSLEQFAFADPFPYGALSDNQKAAFALDPTTVGYSPINHHQVQVDPLDFATTDSITAYFDITKTFNPNLKLKNQTFYDSMNHTKYSSYGFTADYVAMAFENKTSVEWRTFPAENSTVDTIFGLSYRYSDGDERESRGRGYQVLDRRDISVPGTANERFEGAYTGTGNVPYNWRQIGDFSDVGVFGLVDGKFERFGMIVSGRWDRYEATTLGTDTSGVYALADATDDAFTYNASLTADVTDDLTAYLTYAESSYLELGQGGMIARQNVEGGTWLQDSKITEIGLKGTLADQRLFSTLAYYQQEKTSFNNLSGAFDYYESKGVELEMRYAPTKQLSFTAAGTWQQTELLSTPFFLGLPPETLGLDPALVYGGRFVGLGAIIGAPAPIEAPTPEKVISINGTYTADSGWGASLGATYVSSFFSGYAQEVVLPSYLVTRAALFYTRGNWSFRLNANNIFDEKYYNPQFLFWDVFVSPSVGPTVELTTSYKW
ncbi:TonB-dependent siderophore receptor [Synoicihabitans lomoniglobus]|uniref:TonB-dependent receptor n=1 Tax=Synoicihabitans lomoniglobus TaxID=2909285 RepID=A0AAF0I346_9BACT|nr:TonB-dependent receptor [Opitutaceae bacterium LMO-M01]WED65909.1 TonB-dependent receptor [Opitutaceae bacterium LMO-M01]